MSRPRGATDVFAGVASIPAREQSLKKIVRRLLPQVSRMGVYLNGYDRVPGFLRKPGIVVARSQDHGDLRDNGKFFFLNRSEAPLYAAVDDDLLYPPDYVETLVEALDDSGELTAVGAHGALYPSPIVELFEPRILLHFSDPLPYVMPVQLLGTGTLLFDQHRWQLDPSELGEPGMADVWFAAAAARRRARLFAIERTRDWIVPILWDGRTAGGAALFFEGLLDSKRRVSPLRDLEDAWPEYSDLIAALVSVRPFVERFSLHQALDLDSIRMRLGYRPISSETANFVNDRLASRIPLWEEHDILSREDVEAINTLTLDILTGRASAETVSPVLTLIDRLTDLGISDRAELSALPRAMRHDLAPDLVGDLRMTLLERGMRFGVESARSLWNDGRHRATSLKAALAAERASVETGFQRLAAFHTLAEEAPQAALSRLYEYFAASGWERAPDVAALRSAFRHHHESPELETLIGVAALRSSQVDLARATAASALQKWPWDRDVRILAATVAMAEAEDPIDALRPVVRVIDETLEPQALIPFRDLIGVDSHDGHWIHSLGSSVATTPPSAVTEPDVTVIMSAYNDAGTVVPAIRSVLSSVDVDLELIVVDDASTDETLAMIGSIDDPRMRVLRNQDNVGPYVSRNKALLRARGKYVAIADTDDWSHPQRLSYQKQILQQRPGLVACKVAHIRVQPTGFVDLENNLRFVGDGPVSLMFRRWLVDHIGGFDHVRSRGDIEYMRRIEARFGVDALASFDTPMILASSTARSNSKRFDDDALNIYRAAARRWHEMKALTDDLYVPLTGERAPFMAPISLLAYPRDNELNT